MPTTFAPAALIDLNGIARAMSADAILALLTALVDSPVTITERNAGNPDALVEYHGKVEKVWPAFTEGVLLQLDSGNIWRITPGAEDASEPVVTYFT